MKVKISELRPNPFRNIEHYPIDTEKVKTLVASIGQTGFWDNILARKEDGQIQIAYGHHRLAALKQAMKPSDTVDIPVKSLDDATMLKIMANENMDEWKTSPGVIDETVRATRDFLKKHPEELRKLLSCATEQDKRARLGTPAIAEFLGWDKFRVRYALERLGLIDEGIVEPEAIRNLPTERAARDFVKAVKQFKTKPTSAQQKRAAETIVAMEKGERGEGPVRAALLDEMLPTKARKAQKLQDFSEVIARIAKLISQLSGELDTLIEYKAEFNSSVYRKTFERFSFEANKKRLLKKFQTLDQEITNEKLALPKH